MSGGEKIEINIVRFALAIQLAVFGLITIDIIGVHVPVLQILRAVIVFLYLSIVPGILIMKGLRIEISPIKLLLLSVGASVSFTTFLSSLENILLMPFLREPLSELYLALFLGLFILLLTFLCWYKTNSKYSFDKNSLSLKFSPTYVCIFIMPLLIIVGKIEEWEILTFATLSVLSILPLIILLNKRNNLHIPIIWIISLSLNFLFSTFTHKFNMRFGDQTPLITEAVRIAGVWDPYFPATHNSLLLTSVFLPVLSILSGTDVIVGSTCFAAILFSLIPIAMYEFFRTFMDSKVAFLASCLYAVYFYTPRLVLNTKTSFAFFFTSLIILLLTSDEIPLKKKTVLFILFAFSLIVSHYGTAYMFMILSILILLPSLYEKRRGRLRDSFIHPNFVILYLVMIFSWYIYTSGAANFKWGVSHGSHIVANLKDFFSPEESAAMRALVTRNVTPSFSLEATKWLLFILLIFIISGAVKLLYLYLKSKINVKYAILTLAFCSVLLGLTQMGMPRILGFSLLLTAPLSVWGLSEILKLMRVKENKRLLAFSIYLFILFVFTYGIVANSINAATGEATDMSLYGTFREKILESDNLQFKRLLYWGYQPDSTIRAAEWLFVYHSPEKVVYRDSLIAPGSGSFLLDLQLPKKYGGRIVCNLTQPKTRNIEEVLEGNVKSGYVFLAHHNIHGNFIFIERMKNEYYYRTSDYKDVFNRMNRIYDNPGGIILYATNIEEVKRND